MIVVLEMEPQINGRLLKMSLYNMKKLMHSFSKQNIFLNREFYKLLNDLYAVITGKVFLCEFRF